MIDMSDIINDPELAQSFLVLRESGGEFGEGGWIPGRITEISMSGPVLPSSPAELQQVPEGDRVTEAKTFYCTAPLYTTRKTALADMIRYPAIGGDEYKVVHVFDRQANGFIKAIGVRMAGD
jgi:hypothetical protein